MLKHYLLLTSILHVVIGNYFCNFPCGEKHTACSRQPCGLSKACGKNASLLRLNNEDRQWILDLHNGYRNKIALGEDTNGGNSQASNMRALSYDKEIEFVAQCWSNACVETGKSHDTCRSTKRFLYVGQNMYSSGSSIPLDFRDKRFLTNAVQAWYSEISQCNTGEINSFRGVSGIIGHFTQVVWAETTHIGCGRTFYMAKNGFYSIYIYCNYGTGGNILGKPVYDRGEPCSNCERLKCNSKYKGLCGKVKSVDENTWRSPFSTAGSRLKISFCMIVVFIIVLLFV